MKDEKSYLNKIERKFDYQNKSNYDYVESK